jgi:hypothetical protein
VYWEPKQDQTGESLSESRKRQAESKRRQMEKEALDNPHVQLLINELDAKLEQVRAPGAAEQGNETSAT